MVSMPQEVRDRRAAFYTEKAREAYRLGEDAKSPEIHAACLALAAHWAVLARFHYNDPISDLLDGEVPKPAAQTGESD